MRLRTLNMTEHRKFSIAAALTALLAVLTLAYTWGLGPLADRMAEEARRRVRYENAIEKKGLSLHPGAFWKEKR